MRRVNDSEKKANNKGKELLKEAAKSNVRRRVSPIWVDKIDQEPYMRRDRFTLVKKRPSKDLLSKDGMAIYDKIAKSQSNSPSSGVVKLNNSDQTRNVVPTGGQKTERNAAPNMMPHPSSVEQMQSIILSDASQKTNVNSVLFPGVGYAAGGNLAKMDEIHALERMLNR